MSAAALAAALVGALVPFSAAPAVATAADGELTRVHVSQRNGHDGGDGSPERPFATIRRALDLLAKLPQRRAEVLLDVGHFGADTGETFPIRLPDGVRLVGYGSQSCEIVGLEDQPVIELPKSGRVAIESVALRRGTVGVLALRDDPDGALEVKLVDVAIERCPLGVDLSAAIGRLALAADGLRVSDATTGLAAAGGADLTLVLDRCVVRSCTDGVVISTEGAGPDGPLHDVTVRASRFDGNAEHGFVRRGKDARNRAAPPWRFESSAFRGNRFGLLFEIPGGDVPFAIRDCDFEENRNEGITIVGSGDPLEGTSTIEDCRLRWNGIGAKLMSMGRRVELARTRIEDSIGIGLHFGNFIGERSFLRASECVLVRNGAAGFFGLCERENGIAIELEACTIADNRGAGVERRNRKRGSGPYRLVRCVVAGNATELVKVEPGETIECVIGPEPGFVDRAARDYRLAPDSPARAAAQAATGADAAPGAPAAIAAPPARR